MLLDSADHETGGLTIESNNSAGQYPDVSWTISGSHTSLNVPVFAQGVKAELVNGVIDNNFINQIFKEADGNPTP